MISIQAETAADRDAIRHVTIDAFSGSELGHNGEAELIEALRSNCQGLLSLVAFDDGVLVGHILFTPVVIRNAFDELDGMGLAPLSVLTTHQRKGVGSALVASGLERLRKSNNLFTVVAGHSDYYLRFGFVPAGEFGVSHGFEGMPQQLFFIHVADPARLASVRDGTAYYQPDFGPQRHGT